MRKVKIQKHNHCPPANCVNLRKENGTTHFVEIIANVKFAGGANPCLYLEGQTATLEAEQSLDKNFRTPHFNLVCVTNSAEM